MKIVFSSSARVVCLCFAAATVVSRVHAQGYIAFNNKIPGQLIAPIYGGEPGNSGIVLRGNPTNGFPAETTVYHGLPLEGTGYTAQLWAGPMGAAESQLTPVATTTFLTGANAGFVQPSSAVVISTVPPGGVATLQWRVWKNLGGSLPSWVSVQGSVPRGSSSPFNSPPLGSTPGGAPVLSGLRSFNITCLSCGTRPVVIPQVSAVNAFPGETVTFNLNSFGENPIIYQWLFNGTPLPFSPSIGQTISGSGGQILVSLSISNLQAAYGGQYSLVASNDFGQYISSNMSLTVFPPPWLTSRGLTPQGNYSLRLDGAPNRRYALESSADLLSWSPFVTLTNALGQVAFTETNRALDPTRFFRARALPLP